MGEANLTERAKIISLRLHFWLPYPQGVEVGVDHGRDPRLVTRGFSMIELLVSLVIFSTVTALSLVAFTKIQARIQKGKIEGEQSLLLENIKQSLQSDVAGALALGVVTTNSIHFDGQRTFGIMPVPFEDPGARVSDAIQIFVEEAEFSLQDSFELLTVDCTGGPLAATIRVSGDFRPTVPLSEDIFAISDGDNLELYSVEGAINVVPVGGGSSESIISMNENLHLCGTTPGMTTIFRVARKEYRIEDVSGRYQFVRETHQGAEILGEDVRSMRIFYYFDTSEAAGAKADDCREKSGLRWFAHSADATDCSWDLVTSVRFEIVQESLRGKDSTVSQNPHTGESNDRIKTTGFFALSRTTVSGVE